MSTLYIIATPIGNLEDITLRALRVLKEADVVFAEDTREAGKLLSHFDIKKPLERYDEHSHARQSQKVISYLEEGKSVAYISDAGTPGISDPGAMLVKTVREKCLTSDVQHGDPDYFRSPKVKHHTSHVPDQSPVKNQPHVNCHLSVTCHMSHVITPIPGPSALTTAISVAGITKPDFTFLGFLPHKKGRETLFSKIAEDTKTTFVFYESPHRIMKTLGSLHEKLDNDRRVVVARELTKIHEEIQSGTAEQIFEYYTSHTDKVRGEFVVIVEGK